MAFFLLLALSLFAVIVAIIVSALRADSVVAGRRPLPAYWRGSRGAWAALWAALGAFFTWVWHERFYQRIDCFNELGNCYDPVEQINYTDAGGAWIIVAFAFFLALSASLFRTYRMGRRQRGTP